MSELFRGSSEKPHGADRRRVRLAMSLSLAVLLGGCH